MNLWVVKLGGSLLGSALLPHWLATLMQHGAGKVVIVPGGGPFADAVRLAQQQVGFDDATAHHAALLAMEQYALVLQALQPGMLAVENEQDVARGVTQKQLMVWMPCRRVLTDETIEKSWAVTSDSLAAWLAEKIAANRLVVVKHLADSRGTDFLSVAVEEGIIDGAFLKMASALTCPVDVVDVSTYLTLFDENAERNP